MTARDLQQKDGQWTRAKSFDTFAAFGPYLAFPNELDITDTKIACRVNGETRQASSTSNLLFDIPYLIEFITEIMYDLSTHKETRITNSTIPEDGFGYDLGIAISGNRILWGGAYRYCIYDISTKKETHLDHGTASSPDIYGDKIVWQDNRNGNWDIYIFDLAAKTEIHTTNLTNQTVPAIYKNLVVWEDERNGGHVQSVH